MYYFPLANVVIKEAIPLHFSEVVGDVFLSEGGDLARDVLMTMPDYINLVCFFCEKLGTCLLH